MSEKNKNDHNNSISSLADIILVIAKHLKLILLITILVVIITIVYVHNEFEPEYVSSSVLLIPIENNSGSALSNFAIICTLS
jgi:capsular polysaccharide biosynthesis protein